MELLFFSFMERRILFERPAGTEKISQFHDFCFISINNDISHYRTSGAYYFFAYGAGRPQVPGQSLLKSYQLKEAPPEPKFLYIGIL
jgi:hypothetical protein